MSGSSELALELTDIVINGTPYPLLTSTYEVKGKGEGGNTAKKVIGGAGIGAAAGAGGGAAIAASKERTATAGSERIFAGISSRATRGSAHRKLVSYQQL